MASSGRPTTFSERHHTLCVRRAGLPPERQRFRYERAPLTRIDPEESRNPPRDERL
ncbi:hypothetical protein SGPA1_11234 [Streptomyces misionensis JCM 4497]